MGNSGGREAEDEKREVFLCLHAVHNLDHTPTESYYAMATTHTEDGETSITSERSAHLSVGPDTLISMRVFLHERGAPLARDRPVGQVAIPVRQMLEQCGRGLYQTWMLLEPFGPYDEEHFRGAPERFQLAMQAASERFAQPRLCLSLLETSVDPETWLLDEEAQKIYYNPLLVSHSQHVLITRAYFNSIEALEAEVPRPESPVRGSRRDSNPLVVGASDEVTQLNQALDDITDEANQRIESGNESILRLKAELSNLREVEGPRLLQEHLQARRRLEGERLRNEELKARQVEPDVVDLEALRKEVHVLTEQKAALMHMVQDVYGSARDMAASGTSTPSSPMGPPSGALLPDPRTVLR